MTSHAYDKTENAKLFKPTIPLAFSGGYTYPVSEKIFDYLNAGSIQVIRGRATNAQKVAGKLQVTYIGQDRAEGILTADTVGCATGLTRT